jgi:hypothetical protein
MTLSLDKDYVNRPKSIFIILLINKEQDGNLEKYYVPFRRSNVKEGKSF